MSNAFNPFAPPESSNSESGRGVMDAAAAETMRRALLNHEMSIRWTGVLYYIEALLLLAVLANAVYVWWLGAPVTKIAFSVYAGFAACGALAGYWLRRLDARARPAVAVVAIVGLLAIPCGTIVNAYILWIVFSRQGSAVLSPEYRHAVEMTPHVRSRTAWYAYGLALIATALLAFATTGALLIRVFG